MSNEKKLKNEEIKNEELTDEQVTKVIGGGVQDVSVTYGGCGKDVAKDWAKSQFGYY